MNIRLLVEYDGKPYSGWQRQLECPTIQQTLEDSLRGVTGEKTVVTAAGRTDAGVHARGQVCNFLTSVPMDPVRWASILNHSLPSTIRIVRSEEVPESFHSQRDAISKVYEYRVLNRKHPSALESRALFFPRRLDWSRIGQAMTYFLGEHDFRSFQGAKTAVRTTTRRVIRFELDDSGREAGLFRMEIEGNGFLKQMVRALVGTLLKVGESKIVPEAIPVILRARDRRMAGPTAPAVGLCLVRVNYA